jgi:hypothetical protein
MQVRPDIRCYSGLSFSAQAGRTAWCSPKVDGAAEYTHVEVSNVSNYVRDFLPYRESFGESNPRAIVYGMVPVEVVRKVIADNRGARYLPTGYLACGIPKFG